VSVFYKVLTQTLIAKALTVGRQDWLLYFLFLMRCWNQLSLHCR